MSEVLEKFVVDFLEGLLDGSYLREWYEIVFRVFKQVMLFDNTPFEDILVDELQSVLYEKVLKEFPNAPPLSTMTEEVLEIYLPYSGEFEERAKEVLRESAFIDFGKHPQFKTFQVL